jgi:hypothetical protein
MMPVLPKSTRSIRSLPVPLSPAIGLITMPVCVCAWGGGERCVCVSGLGGVCVCVGEECACVWGRGRGGI